MLESRYARDNKDLTRKSTVMEEFLNLTQEARLPFLKCLDVNKNHIATNPAGDIDNNVEDEEEDFAFSRSHAMDHSHTLQQALLPLGGLAQKVLSRINQSG